MILGHALSSATARAIPRVAGVQWFNISGITKYFSNAANAPMRNLMNSTIQGTDTKFTIEMEIRPTLGIDGDLLFCAGGNSFKIAVLSNGLVAVTCYTDDANYTQWKTEQEPFSFPLNDATPIVLKIDVNMSLSEANQVKIHYGDADPNGTPTTATATGAGTTNVIRTLAGGWVMAGGVDTFIGYLRSFRLFVVDGPMQTELILNQIADAVYTSRWDWYNQWDPSQAWRGGSQLLEADLVTL